MAPKQPNTGLSVGLNKGHVLTKKELAPRPYDRKGFIAMYATLARRDVDLCLIPESPFYLEGSGGLFEFVKKRLREEGHMVIVIAEGARQEILVEENSHVRIEQDASGNKLLQDVGLWVSHKIKLMVVMDNIVPNLTVYT